MNQTPTYPVKELIEAAEKATPGPDAQAHGSH